MGTGRGGGEPLQEPRDQAVDPHRPDPGTGEKADQDEERKSSELAKQGIEANVVKKD